MTTWVSNNHDHFPLTHRRMLGETWCGKGISFKEPNPIGSRPSDLIGLCGPPNETPPPQHTKIGKEDKEKEKDPTGAFERRRWEA